ncbi:MAG: alpha/beta hydrolase fold family protein [Marmoricola sp.]|nr:alpha/beta hydrolase fold family protein [Marmoricola sp.]
MSRVLVRADPQDRSRGSLTVRLGIPFFRLISQTGYRYYASDLVGLRGFLDRAAAFSGAFARPVNECTISGSVLAGLPTRVFEPDDAVAGRTVLYLHGGGFVMYPPRAYDAFLSRLAVRLRARIVMPDYRLAPENPFPAGIEDCFAAYRAVLTDGQDPAALIVAGESAGANATLVTLQRARAEALPMPAGAILLSGGFDFSWASPSVRTNARRDPAIGRRGLDFLTRWFTPDAAPTDPRISPVYGEFAGLPPLLFQTGSTEVLRDDSVRAAERALVAGVPARLEIYPYAPHAWHQLGTWLPETREALTRIADFVSSETGW